MLLTLTSQAWSHRKHFPLCSKWVSECLRGRHSSSGIFNQWTIATTSPQQIQMFHTELVKQWRKLSDNQRIEHTEVRLEDNFLVNDEVRPKLHDCYDLRCDARDIHVRSVRSIKLLLMCRKLLLYVFWVTAKCRQFYWQSCDTRFVSWELFKCEFKFLLPKVLNDDSQADSAVFSESSVSHLTLPAMPSTRAGELQTQIHVN